MPSDVLSALLTNSVPVCAAERLDIAYETLVDERPEGGELAEVKERRPWVPLGAPMRSPRVSAAAAWLYAPTKVRFASQRLDISSCWCG